MTNYTLTAAPGAFSLTGNAATIFYGYRLVAAPGAFSLTGNAATIFYGYKLVAAPGAFALAGSAGAKAFGEALTQAMTASFSEAFQFQAGANVVEAIRVQLVDVTTGIYGLTQSERVLLTQAIQTAWPVAVTQGLTITETVRAAMAVVVLDRLQIAGVVAAQAKYGITIAELIGMSDALLRLLSGNIVEYMQTSGTFNATLQASGVVSDGVILADALGDQLILSVQLADTVALDDDQLLKMIFSGTITEDITISAAYVAPDGSFTTWAINTRSNAVTEYQDWVFNSFAKVGRKYIGANRNGIYELNGVDDDGASIPAYIRSGLFQPGGSRYSAFKAAYLGMRIKDTAEDVYLKIIQGDDSERVYRVRVQDMHTTRVDLGKGLRSRYYAWELDVTGADFDLESITFIPLVAKRRIG